MKWLAAGGMKTQESAAGGMWGPGVTVRTCQGVATGTFFAAIDPEEEEGLSFSFPSVDLSEGSEGEQDGFPKYPQQIFTGRDTHHSWRCRVSKSAADRGRGRGAGARSGQFGEIQGGDLRLGGFRFRLG